MRPMCVDLQQLKHCALLESLTKMHKPRRQRHFYIYPSYFFFVGVDQSVCVGCAHFKNSSSWVLYNMASFYWRMKNEPQKAVDCVVRALHFSPRYRRTRTEAPGRCNLLIESGSSQVFRRILTLCVCVCVRALHIKAAEGRGPGQHGQRPAPRSFLCRRCYPGPRRPGPHLRSVHQPLHLRKHLRSKSNTKPLVHVCDHLHCHSHFGLAVFHPLASSPMFGFSPFLITHNSVFGFSVTVLCFICASLAVHTDAWGIQPLGAVLRAGAAGPARL